MTISLSDLNDAFRINGNERPPDGTYAAKIVKSELGLSKAENRQVRTDLELINPLTGIPYYIQKYHGIEKPLIRYFKNDLAKLGILIDNIEELPSVLNRLTGWVIEIEFQEEGEWYSINFVRTIARN